MGKVIVGEAIKPHDEDPSKRKKGSEWACPKLADSKAGIISFSLGVIQS